jgi:peptidyl-prolyl cis-trans isomerase SurA
MTRLAAALLLSWALLLNPAQAQQAVVIATVNDKPVTSYDVLQRAALMKALGDPREQNPKLLANEIIDDIVKIDEATKLKINPTDKDIDDRLQEVAKNLKTDVPSLKKKLNDQGISTQALTQFFAAQISFGRLAGTKFRIQVNVTDADVDKKMADIKAEINGKVSKLEADPRRQPIKVYTLLQIDLPVDTPDPQLLQSRAIEAQQIVSKFKGCASAKKAAAGIFNVKVGQQIEADSRKLPPPMKAAFDKNGVGSAIGPVRGPKGLQVLGYCGTRMITPPKLNVTMPTRDQVKSMALDQKFQDVKVKYSAILRKSAVIEYKDPAYAQ